MSFVLRAFQNGMDGVYIGGCHLNECHYVTDGNYHALSMVLMTKKLMKLIGLDPDRLRIEWTSAGEGIRFAEIVGEFVESLREIGPLGRAEELDDESLKLRLDAVNKLVPYIRLLERERLRTNFKTQEEYEEFFSSPEVDALFNKAIGDKLAVSQILSLLEEKPLSTADIAQTLQLNPSTVSVQMNHSSRQGLVRYDTRSNCYALAR
jgi:F420-non-reducing hydrogenase iron-sulfur subunit